MFLAHTDRLGAKIWDRCIRNVSPQRYQGNKEINNYLWTSLLDYLQCDWLKVVQATNEMILYVSMYWHCKQSQIP